MDGKRRYPGMRPGLTMVQWLAGIAAVERRADLARARAAAAEGDVAKARRILAKYNLSYIAVEIVPDDDRNRGNG